MFEDQGNELYPVSSFQKYISKIPKRSQSFLPPSKKQRKVRVRVVLVGANGCYYLGSMLSSLSKEAGTSVIYTNHCIRSTTIQKLAEVGLEAREIMTVRGHRSESSLQSYWTPSLDNRKRWSNLLCAGREHKRPLGVSLSTSSETSPAEQQRAHMDCVNSCFNNWNFNGSMQVNFYNSPK